MEISALVRVSLKSKPSMRPERQLIRSVLCAAITGEEGLAIAQYPAYRLRKPVESERLPASKYARAALLALKESREAPALPALAQHYSRRYVNAARCPEFWMWCVLERELVRLYDQDNPGFARLLLLRVFEVPASIARPPQSPRLSPPGHGSGSSGQGQMVSVANLATTYLNNDSKRVGADLNQHRRGAHSERRPGRFNMSRRRFCQSPIRE
jgi:hypothetical protein